MSADKHTPASVRVAVEAAISQFGQRAGRFAWPDDACTTEPWGYELHMGWVEAWNQEGRTTPAVEFLRGWLADDEHILAAFERAADFANGDPPGWPTRPGQSSLRQQAEDFRKAQP